MFLQLVSDFHLNASSSMNEGLLFDKSSDDTKGIMEGSISLIEHQLVATSEEDGDGLALVGASSHLDNLGCTASTALFNKVGLSEFLGLELVNMSDWGSTDSFRDEVNVITVDVLNNHDLFLGEEMECQVADGFSEDALLKEKNVGS